jgi:hypothetical protein
MVDTAVHLEQEVLPAVPIRHCKSFTSSYDRSRRLMRARANAAAEAAAQAVASAAAHDNAAERLQRTTLKPEPRHERGASRRVHGRVTLSKSSMARSIRFRNVRPPGCRSNSSEGNP